MDLTLNLPVVEDEQHRAAAIVELLTTENLEILKNGLWLTTDSTQKNLDTLEETITSDKTKDHAELRETWEKGQERLKVYARLRDLIYQIQDGSEPEDEDDD